MGSNHGEVKHQVPVEIVDEVSHDRPMTYHTEATVYTTIMMMAKSVRGSSEIWQRRRAPLPAFPVWPSTGRGGINTIHGCIGTSTLSCVFKAARSIVRESIVWESPDHPRHVLVTIVIAIIAIILAIIIAIIMVGLPSDDGSSICPRT